MDRLATYNFRISPQSAPSRLDVALTAVLPGLGRSQLKSRVESVLVNGRCAKLSQRVREGDEVVVVVRRPPEIRVIPQPIPLSVVCERPRYVVIDKAQGMVVHPGAGVHEGTLVNALMHRYRGQQYFDPAAQTEEPARPGIVHRLDRETSGVMIVARDHQTHAALVSQFAARTTEKEYVALVKGRPRHRFGRIEGAIGRERNHRRRFCVVGGVREMPCRSWEWDEELPTPPSGAKAARTTYRIVATYREGYSLLRLRLHTGRTHQLRVHLLSVGVPIVGDPLYARVDPKMRKARMMLHARSLALVPEEGGRRERFLAPIPERFPALLRLLHIK